MIMKIGDRVRVKDCRENSYHFGEAGIEGIVIRNDKTRSFPIKLDSGNCYLEKCLIKLERNK